MIRTSFKALWLAGVVGWHWVAGHVFDRFITDPEKLRALRVRRLASSSRRALQALSIQVRIEDLRTEPTEDANYLMVSNHLSYTDVLALSAWKPAAFVTSVETRETPMLGRIADFGGSFFVERRNSYQVRADLKAISSGLKGGLNVMVFPEATSSDGKQVKPFKRGLLTAAKLSGVAILPICVNYLKVNGKPMTPEFRDSVFYYGDMTFGAHLIRLLRLDSVEVELKILDAITSDDEGEPTEIAYQKVTEAFRPVA